MYSQTSAFEGLEAKKRAHMLSLTADFLLPFSVQERYNECRYVIRPVVGLGNPALSAVSATFEGIPEEAHLWIAAGQGPVPMA